MKKFYSLLITVLVTVAAIAQTTNWTGAVNTDWQTVGNWDNGVPNTNTEIAVFNIGSPVSVTNVPTATIGGLSVTGTTVVTLSHTAGRTLTIANNTGTDLTVDANSELVLGTNINVTLAAGSAGNPTTASIAGTLTVNTNRTYNTTNGNVNTTVTGTGVIDNSGTVSANAVTEITVESGGRYIHAQNGGTIPTATWNAASTCEITGMVGTDPSGDAQTFGNLIYNATAMTGTRNMGGAGLSVVGNLEILSTGTGTLVVALATLPVGGNFTLEAGIFRIGNNTNRTLNVSGGVSIEGGTLQMSTGNNAADRGTINCAGDFSHSGGTITETLTGRGVVNFTGNTVQLFSKSVAAIISNDIDFTINANAIVDFGIFVLDGSAGTFTLSGGGKMITANAGGIPSTITVTGAKSYNSAADYEFQSAATGLFTTTPTASTARNFTVNNTSGNVTLSQPMAVTGTLALTAGALITNTTNLVTINAGAGTSGSSFVDGPLDKIGNTAFTFPVGKIGAGRRTIGMTAPSSSSTFRAEFLRTDPHTLSGAIGSGLVQISACEYWTMSRTAGTGTGSAITSWESGSSCSGAGYVGNLATLRVARLNAGTWVDDGNALASGDVTVGTVTASAISNFNFSFALGSAAPDNPLPVMFADVKAFQKNSGVQVEWSNLTERDLIRYVVERSANGQSFAAINEQQPKSNSNDKESYSAYDASPLSGVNFYRIKVYEIGGKIVYSKVLKVDLSGNQQGFSLYPNPVSNGQVSFSINTKQGQYAVKVLNSAGQQVYSQRLNHQGGMMTQTVNLSTVKPGIYNMVITGGNYRESKMFIIQ